jgi:L-ascorbate 6-phosphate lactonase
MMPFDIRQIRKHRPTAGKALIYWLGGAGFVFTFADGEVVCIDPYLGDAVERIYGGFRRLSLPPVKADELFFDTLLLTHDHGDHLDVDSMEPLMQANPHCRVLAPKPCVGFLRDHHIAHELVSPGSISKIGNVTIKTVAADHGDLCPEAVGFLFTFSGRQLYFTGDTAYNKDLMAETIMAQPEILVPCINTAYGNLSEREAAVLANACGAKMAIPSHFGLFVEHGGCPRRFWESLQVEAPAVKLLVLTPGRGVEI